MSPLGIENRLEKIVDLMARQAVALENISRVLQKHLQSNNVQITNSPINETENNKNTEYIRNCLMCKKDFIETEELIEYRENNGAYNADTRIPNSCCYSCTEKLVRCCSKYGRF